MKFTFVILLAAALSASASPVAGGACNSGTFDEYVALGNVGCEHFGYTWRDFTFAGTNGATPLNPADLMFSFRLPNLANSIIAWDATASWTVAPGETIILDFGFAVSGGPVYTVWSGAGISGHNASTAITKEGCLNGYFVTSVCTGAHLGNAYQYDLDPAATAFAIQVHDQRTSNLAQQFESIQGQVRFFANLASEAPEPSSLLIVGFGIAIGYIRHRRSIVS